jgi:hypothetical protein
LGSNESLNILPQNELNDVLHHFVEKNDGHALTEYSLPHFWRVVLKLKNQFIQFFWTVLYRKCSQKHKNSYWVMYCFLFTQIISLLHWSSSHLTSSFSLNVSLCRISQKLKKLNTFKNYSKQTHYEIESSQMSISKWLDILGRARIWYKTQILISTKWTILWIQLQGPLWEKGIVFKL